MSPGNETTSTAPLNTCGCCSGLEPLTPATISNSPGLTALAYRVGTHGSFKETMLAAISGDSGLAGFSARDDNDPAIALMDSWAAVLDVLTFYQERIANEGFLRTAVDLRSVLELANSIGYRLNPGVAASVYLAFSMDTVSGGAASVDLAVGTKAQSQPQQNQLPQTFETVEEITAYRDWQAIPALSRYSPPPVIGQTQFYLQGVSTNLNPGDVVLIVGDERLASRANTNWDVRRVVSAVADSVNQWTIVTLDRGVGDPARQPARSNAKFYALRQRASLFGYSAPDWRAMPASIQAAYSSQTTGATVAPTDWPNFSISLIAGKVPGSGLQGAYYNDGNFTNLVLTRTDPSLNFAFGTSPVPAVTSQTYSIRWTGILSAPAAGTYTFYVHSPNSVRLWIQGNLIIDNWSNPNPAEQQATFQIASGIGGPLANIQIDFMDAGTTGSIQLSWSGPNIAKQIIPAANLFSSDVRSLHLDAVYPKIIGQPDGWIVLENSDFQEAYQIVGAVADARVNFTLTAKTTRLALAGKNLTEEFDTRVRDTVVFGQSDYLPFAPRPIPVALSGLVIPLTADPGPIPRGRNMLVSGKSSVDGSSVTEIVQLDSQGTLNGIYYLHLTRKLQNSYQLDGLTVNANLALATHGETKNEILGSANGSAKFQEFTLSQKPLTYVPAATAGGAVSTLQVRVNGLLWNEVPTLYNAQPGDRVYVTSISDQGAVTVQFGDGVTGARPPSGNSNVTAQYRVGTGLSGMLAPGQISLLLSRPLGLKTVVNPLAPDGAGDPETVDQARANAPLTVLTLDRIVSLEDYEDFTRAFAGIGKARADMLWEGEHAIVYLTVASATGAAVASDSTLMTFLSNAIDQARDPAPKVEIASFQPIAFNVQAELLIDSPTYITADVLAAAAQSVGNAFSFTNRDFAQPVSSSEVIALLQSVPGVIAVRLTGLSPSTVNALPGIPFPMLSAQPARWVTDANGNRAIQPAQLLTVNPNGILLSEMTQP